MFHLKHLLCVCVCVCVCVYVYMCIYLINIIISYTEKYHYEIKLILIEKLHRMYL